MTTARHPLLPSNKARLGYWLLAAVALLVFAGAVYLFVGTLVTGLFLYYAVRPINRRMRSVVEGDGLAAVLTLFLVVVPLLALVGYVAFIAVQNVDALLNQDIRNLLEPYVDLGSINSLSDLAEDPQAILDQLRQSGLQGVISMALGAVGLITNAVIHVFLMSAVVFYLLRDDRRLAGWFRSAVGEDSPAHVLGRHIDRDVSQVYFSNVLFMTTIGVLSALGYTAYNLVAPPSVQIPLPIVLGVLTGVASIVPLVVGKLVYVPVAAFLFGAALQNPNGVLIYPIAFTVGAFLFLDFIPLTFLLPVMAGRALHSGLMIFAYVGGTLVFGWYGLFLGPLVLVVTLRVWLDLVPSLVRGDPVTPSRDDTAATDPPDGDEQSTADGTTTAQSDGTRSDGGEAADPEDTADSGDPEDTDDPDGTN